MLLNDTFIRNVKPTDKLQKFKDGESLFLHVKPNGTKLWIFAYRFQGKQRTLSIGVYPDVGLKKAREVRAEARERLAAGIDPNESKKVSNTGSITFKSVALEWVNNRRNVWSAGHLETVEQRLNANVYAVIGDMPITDITPQDVLKIIRNIEKRRAYEVANMTLGICSLVFRYAVAIGVCPSDPCRDLRGAMVPHKKGKFAALTKPKEAGALMRNIEEYHGSFTVKCALQFSALTFCRPNEIRKAEWQEIDFERALWTIPASKMKMRVEHIVPLSRQAIEVLNAIKELTGGGVYVFPTPRTAARPLTECAVLSAIRSMGYSTSEMTAHGFRAMASTLLNEIGARPDVIETQLAHAGADKIRSIYNRAEYMQERRKLMQEWADYLVHLKGI